MNKKKPPLGIIPRELWLQGRMLELSRAIKDRLSAGMFDEKAYEWSVELCDMLDERVK